MKKILLAFSVLMLGFFAQTSFAQTKLNVQKFESTIKSNKNIQILDVRTPEEFAQGHLKNAKNMNIYDANFKAQVAKLDKNKPVAVYCKAGGRSANAASILKELGFKNIYDMEGGMTAWQAAGKASEK